LEGFGIKLPVALTSAFDPAKGTIIDLPAIVIILIITLLLMKGSIRFCMRRSGRRSMTT
jgi:APA family basic amino acid/polyamine antiporter